MDNFNFITLNAFRNLWLIMLYSNGLMHVDMKYSTPETYVSTVYVWRKRALVGFELLP